MIIRQLGAQTLSGEGTGEIDVAGWFTSAYSQTAEIETEDGSYLTAASVAALVAAMATYQGANASFDPATATAMPVNATLTSAINAAWRQTIVGTAGNDTLTGTYDSETIIGEQGNDTLTGGPGQNTWEQPIRSRSTTGTPAATPTPRCRRSRPAA